MQHANTLSLTSETKWSVDNDQFKWSFRFMKTLSFSIEKRWSKLHFAIESFNLAHFALVLHILCDNLTFCELKPAIFKYSMSLSTENTIESFKWVFKWYVRSFDQFNVFFSVSYFCVWIYLQFSHIICISYESLLIFISFEFDVVSPISQICILTAAFIIIVQQKREREREQKKMQHFVRRFVKWR